jgi:hypothetical protein
MSWLGIVVSLICLYLAFRVAAFFVKLLLWVLVIAGIYIFVAPMLGLPALF